MANFRTHLAVGTIASGLLATLATAAAVVTSSQVMSVTLAGALGSVLPDIDLQRSRSSRLIFFFLGLFLSFCVLFSFSFQYSIMEMWILWLLVFIGVCYVGQYLFHRFATHRGIFHSLLAAIFFMLVTVIVFHKMFNVTPAIAWLAGAFMLFGYVVHLILDEIYSVDFDGHRVKRSFGTALKFFEYRRVGCSLAMGVAVVLAYFLTPSSEAFLNIVGSSDIWAFLGENLIPQENWFGLNDKFEKITSLFNEMKNSLLPDSESGSVGSISQSGSDVN